MRDTVFGVSPRVAKHASDKRATCPPSHLYVAETRNVSVVSQKHLRVSCKVSEVAKLGDTEETSMSHATCLLA